MTDQRTRIEDIRKSNSTIKCQYKQIEKRRITKAANLNLKLLDLSAYLSYFGYRQTPVENVVGLEMNLILMSCLKSSNHIGKKQGGLTQLITSCTVRVVKNGQHFLRQKSFNKENRVVPVLLLYALFVNE